MGGANVANSSLQKPTSSSFGYPVKSSDELKLTEYFKKNPHVAGMAWGAGLNGSSPDDERSIVVNPFNKEMEDENKKGGLIKIEAARHFMDENNYSPQFRLTESQNKWKQGLGAYSNDDLALKQSIISRLMVGDYVPDATDEQKKEVQQFNLKLQQNNTTQNMGGLNTQTANATQQQTSPISDAQKEQETYARLDKQKMSGSADQSARGLLRDVKGLAKDVVGNVKKKTASLVDEFKGASPNVYGREFSKPMSADDAIEKGLKESESSYGGN